MSFYRTMLAVVAAAALASPAFADEVADMATQTSADNAAVAASPQLADNAASSVEQGQAVSTDEAMPAKTDLNKATAKELVKLKGMNAARAKALVAYRTQHGDFKSLEDLKEVKGFKKLSQKKLKALQDQLTVG